MVKTILLRIDLNSSIKNRCVVENPRFKAHAQTIKEFKKKHAVVLLSHQGRKGGSDYLESLEQHCKLLNKHVKVKYVHSLFPDKIILGLKKGEVILLKNVRSLDYESKEQSATQHSRTLLVKNLSSVCDTFVLDAFSVAHRSHASVVGFTKTLPSYASKLLKKELKSLSKLKNPKKPFTVVLGGAKLEEALILLKNLKADKFLLGGLVGEVGLAKAGLKLGKKDCLLKKEFVNGLKLSKKVFLPIDLVLENKKVIGINELPVNKNPVDIGPATIKMFSDLLKGSKTVLMKGPLGVFEKGFSKGTLSIMKSVSELNALTVLGGGHSTTVGGKGFSYVCTAGGALIVYLSGKRLPGLVNLKNL
ncbi:MAG: phosphoglycerate kinase [Nanoarchaeota archaeon]|nr:phosphoglycerate kinase [Nanoarchaeota archaeon]